LASALWLVLLCPTAGWPAGQTWSPGDSEANAASPARPVAEHAKAVEFGNQPLWAPAAVITEAMRRDLVLSQDLAELGLALRMTSFLKGADANRALAKGRLDVVVAGDLPALWAVASQGAVVASLIHNGQIAFVARQRVLLPELRGKAVGCTLGSSAHHALLRVLDMYGVGENQVTLAFMDIIDMPKALEEGRVAAFVSWEPNTSMILREHEDFAVIHRSQFSGYLYFSGEFARRAPEAARRVVAAQIRAMGWLQANDQHLLRSCRWALEAYQAAVGHAPGLSAPQLAQVVKSDLLDVAPIPEIPEPDLASEGAMARAFAFLKKLGQLPGEATWEDTSRGFDRSLINQVLQQPERYRLDEHRYAPAAD
jgi:ABC-type nitrate/sulfonate/bicarbonate transport system substrate-binding protein